MLHAAPQSVWNFIILLSMSMLAKSWESFTLLVSTSFTFSVTTLIHRDVFSHSASLCTSFFFLCSEHALHLAVKRLFLPHFLHFSPYTGHLSLVFFMWFPTVPAVHCAALSLASCSLDSNEPVLRWLCWSPGRTLLPCKAVCMCQVSSFSPAVVSPSCWHYESHMLSESLNVQKLQNLSATAQWHRCW